jgi:hypothetical protein
MVPSPSTTMKCKICRRRAMSWCARTSRCARRAKVCRCRLVGYLLRVPCSSLTSPFELFADLVTRVEQLKASDVNMKNLFYREKDAVRYLSTNISS